MYIPKRKPIKEMLCIWIQAKTEWKRTNDAGNRCAECQKELKSKIILSLNVAIIFYIVFSLWEVDFRCSFVGKSDENGFLEGSCKIR